MEFLSRWLPAGSPWHLETWPLDDAAAPRMFRVTSTQALVHCPVCRFPPRRIHRHSRRTLAALPWAHVRVVLQLGVRKFCCAHGRGTRRIFTARLPQLGAPGARRTPRLAQRLVARGRALGGTAGGQLRPQWALGVRRNPLRHVLRRLPVPTLPTPPGLGGDDFARRTRQTYGTVRIDRERRQPVVRLPERTAAPVAPWRRQHPGGKVIARARATASAEGARHGAPAATQVADRVHRRQNLRQALAQGFLTDGKALDAVHELGRQPPVSRADGAVAVPVPPPDVSRPAPQRTAQRPVRRETLYEPGWAFHRHGATVRTIAPHVGRSARPVQRALQRATCPGRKRRRAGGHGVLAPYNATLLARWHAGGQTAMRRFRARQPQGDAGR